MNKRGSKTLWISLSIILILVVIGVFLFIGKDYSSDYSSRISDGTLVNPVSQYSVEQAIDVFNEDFVYYLMYQIGAYNLKTTLFGRENPKIQIYADEETYNSEVIKGQIKVSTGIIENPDIIIRTTKLECVLMLKDREYISQSFSSGKSSIELLASKTNLFEKGYLSLYTDLTGKSITGNVINEIFN